MTNKLKFSKADYQRAILTEMGVSQWQLNDSSVVLYQHSENDSPDNQEIDPPVQQMQPQKPDAEQVSVQSVPDQVLLVMPQSDTQQKLVKDVLLTLGLEHSSQLVIDTSPAQYCDYSFAWQLGQQVPAPDWSSDKHQLTTPSLEVLLQPEVKKQLWKQLQADHDSSVR